MHRDRRKKRNHSKYSLLSRTLPIKQVTHRLADQYGHKWVKEFVMQMYKSCGMFSFVVTAHLDRTGGIQNMLSVFGITHPHARLLNVDPSSHDYGKETMGRSFTEAHPEWRTMPMMEVLELYSKRLIANGDGTSETNSTDTRTPSAPLLDIVDGMTPRLPKRKPMMKRKQCEGLVRAFITYYYSESFPFRAATFTLRVRKNKHVVGKQTPRHGSSLESIRKK